MLLLASHRQAGAHGVVEIVGVVGRALVAAAEVDAELVSVDAPDDDMTTERNMLLLNTRLRELRLNLCVIVERCEAFFKIIYPINTVTAAPMH